MCLQKRIEVRHDSLAQKRMLWEDFLTQAHLDIQRAYLLHKNRDYGFAGYCSQQALEKHVKAYIMKHGLTNKPPYDLGHMSMARLLKEIRDTTERTVIRFSRNSTRFRVSTSSARIELQNLEAILRSWQPSLRQEESLDVKPRVQLWKHSLGLKMASEFEKGIESMRRDLIERLVPIGNNFLLFHDTEVRPIVDKISDTAKEQAAQKYVKDLGFFKEIVIQVIRGEIPELQSDQVHQYMIVILEYLHYLLTYEIKNRPQQREFFRLAKEIYMLAYPFKFLDLALKIYPHEDIGRYPTMIDNTSSLELYSDNEAALLVLITEVDVNCQKVEHAIYRRWDKA
jgi:HEPN domain-containing protein